jgi:hypothetical protein
MHALTPSPLLRFALRLDGVVSSAAGVATCSQFASLSGVLGAPAEVVLRIGAFMLIYGVTIGWISTRAQVDQRLTWFVAVGNLIWAIVSVLLTATHWIAPTTSGIALILGQALIVAGFAALQYLGLRQSREFALA